MTEKLVKEMTMYQQSLCDSLQTENERFDEFNQKFNLEQLMNNLQRSCTKLQGLKSDMAMFAEKSKQLKKRAERLQAAKQNQEERFAYEMDRVKQMEQNLKPVVADNRQAN